MKFKTGSVAARHDCEEALAYLSGARLGQATDCHGLSQTGHPPLPAWETGEGTGGAGLALIGRGAK